MREGGGKERRSKRGRKERVEKDGNRIFIKFQKLILMFKRPRDQEVQMQFVFPSCLWRENTL
jgi:hypothetical protein